jgi:hypothetical protein
MFRNIGPRLENLANEKHSSSLSQFVSYEENKYCEYGLWIF